MRKSRLLIAVLAATMFVLAAFGFVACDKDAGEFAQPSTPTDTSYKITFDYNGGNGSVKDAQTKSDGKLMLSALPTPTTLPTGKKFDAWYDAKSGGTQVTLNTVFKKNTTVYARYTDNGTVTGSEYTITFNVNGGTGTVADMQTEGGKLKSLPAGPTAPAGKKFDGWYTAATGGIKVTTSMAFNKATTVYAQYTDIQQGGGGESALEGAVAIDATADDIGYMVDVNAPDKGVEMALSTGDYGDEFVLEKYHLDKDVVIKFQNGTGDIVRTTFEDNCPSAAYFTSVADGIKVVKSGTYTFYVKKDTDQIWVEGTPDFEQIEGDTITITVTCADGTITFIIEKDGDKTPHLHGWTSGGDLFGSWPGKELTDGETVNLSSYNMGDLGLIVNYGSGNAQTADIKNLSAGNKTISVSKDGGHKIS